MSIEERLRKMGEHKPAELPSQNEWDRFRSRGHGRLLRRRVGIVLAAAVIVVVGAQGASSLLQQQAAPLPPAGGDGPARSGKLDPVPPYPGGLVPGAIAIETWYAQGDLLHLDYGVIETASMSDFGVVEATLKRLLIGPSDSSTSTVFPSGTRLIKLDVGRRLATVHLSKFSDGLSPGERDLALASIAATVLQFDDHWIKGVEVLEDGTPLTDAPLTEASFEALLPPIVITWPQSGDYPQSFAESLTFRGTANVFEANVLYELVDLDGKVLADGFTTATCGTGCRGDLSQRVSFEVDEPTLATLNVYSASAEDGSRMFEVSVPVYLCPPGSEIGFDPYAICGQS